MNTFQRQSKHRVRSKVPFQIQRARNNFIRIKDNDRNQRVAIYSRRLFNRTGKFLFAFSLKYFHLLFKSSFLFDERRIENSLKNLPIAVRNPHESKKLSYL